MEWLQFLSSSGPFSLIFRLSIKSTFIKRFSRWNRNGLCCACSASIQMSFFYSPFADRHVPWAGGFLTPSGGSLLNGAGENLCVKNEAFISPPYSSWKFLQALIPNSPLFQRVPQCSRKAGGGGEFQGEYKEGKIHFMGGTLSAQHSVQPIVT